MCIAIPPATQERRRSAAGLWSYLSLNAGRLFGFGTLLQFAALSGAMALGWFPAGTPWLLPLLFMALSTAVLGLSLDGLSLRFSAMAPSYPLYAGSFFLLMTGVLLSWTGLAGWSEALGLGQGLWLAAWLIALRALHWKHHWASSGQPLGVLIQYWLILTLAALSATLTIALLMSETNAVWWISLGGLCLSGIGGLLAVKDRLAI